MKQHIKIWTLMLLVLSSFACKKDLLDEKPDKALLIPTTLSDFRALLENSSVMNSFPALQVLSSDDFIATESGWSAYTNMYERNTYIWSDDQFGSASIPEWSEPYKQIFYANIVLDGLPLLKSANETQHAGMDEIKGAALFYRGHALFNLSMLFAKPYDDNTAERELGIPVPLSSNVNERPGRKSLKYTYEHILNDLLEAEKLLPATSRFKTEPNVVSARAILARVYLVMGDFENAARYAGMVLEVKNSLIDYNSLTTSAARPFPTLLAKDNVELLLYNNMISYSFISSTGTLVNPELYRMYEDNDLRKSVFFNNKGGGIINFKGNFTGNSQLFGGPAVDEMYLIMAESAVRLNKVQDGMDKLNFLLTNRYKTENGKSTFNPYIIADKEVALQIILRERRKELLTRGLRWSDLRRLNRDPDYEVVINRTLNDKNYTLLPNSNKYTFPIPKDEIRGGGIEQNER